MRRRTKAGCQLCTGPVGREEVADGCEKPSDTAWYPMAETRGASPRIVGLTKDKGEGVTLSERYSPASEYSGAVRFPRMPRPRNLPLSEEAEGRSQEARAACRVARA